MDKRDDPNNPFRVGQVLNGRTICGAKTTQKGTPCVKPPMPNGRCYKHGGPTPGGIASPHFRDGRHSKYLPASLAERYEEHVNDPELRQLSDEIALLDTRITQLSETLPEHIALKTWSELKKLWSEVEAGASSGQRARYEAAILAMRAYISEDTEHIDAQRKWTEIASLVDERRKLVDTEQRRLLMAQQMVTVEQAMMMVTASIAALREVVFLYADATTAKHILTEAQRRYTALVSLPASSGTSNELVGQAG